MDTPIDKLIFALGGDVTALNDAFKQAEAAAAKTGTTIQSNLGKGFKDAASQVQSDASAIKSTMSGVEDHVSKVSSHIQVSRREMVYAFRELANGDIQRLPATMALLLSHMLEISPAAIAVGAAVAAIPLAITVAAVKADGALAKLRTSLALTRGASGISLSQATTASIGAAAASDGSISVLGAERAMGGLIGAGVPRSLLGRATTAVGNYALGSGASQEDATNMLARALNDPVKGAEELNKTMHLLSYQQTEEVRGLVMAGEKEQAATIILNEFAAATKDAATQAGLWSKIINNVGNALGDFGHRLATATGGGSPQERLDQLLHARMYQPLPFVGHSQSWKDEVKKLQDEIAASNTKAGKKGYADQVNDDLSEAWKQAAAGSNAYGMQLDDLRKKTEAAGKAAQEAADVHDKNAPIFLRNFQAEDKAYSATKRYGAPGMAEQRQAANAAELARTPLDKEQNVRARQEAQEKHIQELMDPRTSLTADADYQAALQKAGLANAEQLKQQQKRMAAMDAEAAGASKVAAAYDISTAAVARANAESEVDVAITNNQTNAKDRLKAVEDKLATAIAQARQQIGQKIEADRYETAGIQMELAAGGNPLALMHATAAAGAYTATQGAYAKAEGRPDDQADILAHRGQMAGSAYDRAQMDAQKAAQATLYGAQTNLASQQALSGARTSGMSDDDLRRFEVWQKLVEDFNRQGLDPSIEKNQQLFKATLQTNTALSDLADDMQKTSQEAKGLADSITGGIANWIRNPTMNWKDALSGIGQNILSTVVQTNVLDPMNKFLTSQFSNLIGGGELGSSMANPMYVVPVPGLGGLGGGGFGGPLLSGGSSGGGGLLSFLGLGGGGGGSTGNWTGSVMDDGSVIGGAADAAGGGGFFSSIASFLGLGAKAGGGPTQGGRSYLVGEDGPELWTEGANGYMTPAPMVQSALNGRSRGGSDQGGDTNMHFHLPNVTDTKSFIQSRSQVENAAYRMVARGKRNA